MSMTDRAQGVLYGQVIGDSLGSLVEFASPDTIAADYPGGVRELADGGPFRLSAGQPTDDSEMALALARTLVTHGFDIDGGPKVIPSILETPAPTRCCAG